MSRARALPCSMVSLRQARNAWAAREACRCLARRLDGVAEVAPLLALRIVVVALCEAPRDARRTSTELVGKEGEALGKLADGLPGRRHEVKALVVDDGSFVFHTHCIDGSGLSVAAFLQIPGMQRQAHRPTEPQAAGLRTSFDRSSLVHTSVQCQIYTHS